MTRRVLFLVSTTEMGGAEVVIHNIVKYLDRASLEPVVANLGFGRGDFLRRLSKLGVRVHVTRPYRLRNFLGSLKNLAWLADVMRRENIETIVTNGPHPHVYGALAAWLTGRRAIWYVMMIPRRPLRLNGPIEKLALLLPTSHYMMASEACRDAFLRLFPDRDKRVSVVHHGYDPELFRPDISGNCIRQEFSIPHHIPMVAMIARLQRWKGQDYFIRSVQYVLKVFPQVKFVIVGGSVFGLEPEYVKYLVELTNQLNIHEHVLVTGQRSDVAEFLAASEVVVHGSVEPEPGGNTVIEAMAMGKPVVATAIGCAQELIGKDAAGILVPPKDPRAMGEAIVTLLKDKERAAALGHEGRKRATQQFSAPAMTRKVEKIIAGLGQPMIG